MDKREDKVVEAPLEVRPAPSAARVTRPPSGLAVDHATAVFAPDTDAQVAVQEQRELAPGPRLPKRLRGMSAPGLTLPVACAGGACLTRDQFERLQESCNGDKRCLKRANDTSNAP